MLLNKLLPLLISCSFVFGLLAFTPGTSSFSKAPNWLKGEWEGIGYQIDGQTWDVALRYDEKDGLAIQYPTLSCGGTWTIKKASKNRLDIVETITTGADKCDQNVQVVILKINETDISVTYYLPSYRKGPIAYTVLEKK